MGIGTSMGVDTVCACRPCTNHVGTKQHGRQRNTNKSGDSPSSSREGRPEYTQANSFSVSQSNSQFPNAYDESESRDDRAPIPGTPSSTQKDMNRYYVPLKQPVEGVQFALNRYASPRKGILSQEKEDIRHHQPQKKSSNGGPFGSYTNEVAKMILNQSLMNNHDGSNSAQIQKHKRDASASFGLEFQGTKEDIDLSFLEKTDLNETKEFLEIEDSETLGTRQYRQGKQMGHHATNENDHAPIPFHVSEEDGPELNFDSDVSSGAETNHGNSPDTPKRHGRQPDEYSSEEDDIPETYEPDSLTMSTHPNRNIHFKEMSRTGLDEPSVNRGQFTLKITNELSELVEDPAIPLPVH